MSETAEAPTAPEDHPNPPGWWLTIKWQSWLAQLALMAEAIALIRWGIPDAATAPLVIINLGLVAVASVYGAGSLVIDAIKAWRSPHA